MVKELIKNIKNLIKPWVYLKSENYSKTEMNSLLNNKADLVNGLIPENQLPSYVDDVIEGYYHNNNFYEDSSYNNLISPEDSKIYVSLSDNKCYRYSGSVFVEISSSLAIGNTASTALAGNTKYAGSTSQGGSANSAKKLDSSAGAANNPVYFSQGVPTASPYEINTNVPVNAKFTDTIYDDTDVKSDIQDLQNDKQNTLVSGTNVKTINHESILGSGNITIQSCSGATGELPQFTYSNLQDIIANASSGSTIYLNGYFKYNSNENINVISITKPLTIIGEGCIVDGSNTKQCFNITSANVVIKNITFINGRGGIYCKGNNNSITDCKFINCNAYTGGAIFLDGDRNTNTIINSEFMNCSADNGGAICSGTQMAHVIGNITNCSFENCDASNGGAIFSHEMYTIDCVFKTPTDTVVGVTPTYTPLEELPSGERPTAQAIKDYIDSLN